MGGRLWDGAWLAACDGGMPAPAAAPRSLAGVRRALPSKLWLTLAAVLPQTLAADDALDEDVMSAFPLLRFDPRLERRWYHAYQHLYMVRPAPSRFVFSGFCVCLCAHPVPQPLCRVECFLDELPPKHE